MITRIVFRKLKVFPEGSVIVNLTCSSLTSLTRSARVLLFWYCCCEFEVTAGVGTSNGKFKGDVLSITIVVRSLKAKVSISSTSLQLIVARRIQGSSFLNMEKTVKLNTLFPGKAECNH